MLKKKEVYTTITPIPGFIPRQLAVDILHSHSEVITLNPLVLSHKAIPAPRDAAADEFYSTWYEVTERVQVIPGLSKLGSSKISFKVCFHDLSLGLQTHTYVPFGIDIRIRYHIGGNQPGVEPAEHRELGLEALGVPKDGLYLREDIEIRCNISLVSLVKSQQKAASKEMVNRIIRKAELLDAGVLQAMIQDGKLKTINPMDRSQTASTGMGSPMGPPAGFGTSRPTSYQPGGSPQHPYARPDASSSPGFPSPGPYRQTGMYQSPMSPPPIPPKEQVPSPQPMELPGDFQQPGGQAQQSPGLSSNYYAPHHYPPSDSTASNGAPSPGYMNQQPQQHFSAELPANEVRR